MKPIAIAVLVLMTGCVGRGAPGARLAEPVPRVSPGMAKVVFLWPASSCEPGGYYTLAMADGSLVGNVAAGTRLESEFSPGDKTFVAWDTALVDAQGYRAPAYVGILHAHLSENRTYFVRLAFGEWDERGPREVFSWNRRTGIRQRCLPSIALIALGPSSAEWPWLRDWLDELLPIAPAHPTEDASVIAGYRTVGEERFSRMTPQARRLATLGADEGVAFQ